MRTNQGQSFATSTPHNLRLRFGVCVVLGALAAGCTFPGADEAVDLRSASAEKLDLERFLDTDGQVIASSSGGCDAGAYDLGTSCASDESSSDFSSGTTLETVHFCGDGIVDVGEQCDEGSANDGDGCSAECTLAIVSTTGSEGGSFPGSEGGSYPGSEDTGNDGGSDDTTGPGSGPGGSTTGDAGDPGDDATGATPDLGSGTTSDPGDSASGTSSDTGGDCDDICTDGVCGDGILQPDLGEACDDANLEDEDGCSAACLEEFCGDGVLQEGLVEGCDDGNDADGDGCDASCVAEIECSVTLPPPDYAELGGTAGALPFGWLRYEYGEFLPESALALNAAPYGPENQAAADSSTVGIRIKPSYHWHTSTIPYTVSGGLPGACKPIIEAAVAQWNKDVAGVKWVPRGIQADYVAFSNGAPAGVFDSPIGRQGGEQLLRFGNGAICNIANMPGYKGALLHEMMHAAGFDHEQCRIDRDEHITVVKDNIVDDYRFAYDRHSSWSAWVDRGDYDFGSIMHYGDTSFRKPGAGYTMSKKADGGRIIAQRTGLSAGDKASLDELYGEASEILAWVSDGSFVRKKYEAAATKCSDAGYTVPSKDRVLAHWADITKLLGVAKNPTCVWISEAPDAGRHWILHFKNAEGADLGIESAANGGTCTVLCTRTP